MDSNKDNTSLSFSHALRTNGPSPSISLAQDVFNRGGNTDRNVTPMNAQPRPTADFTTKSRKNDNKSTNRPLVAILDDPTEDIGNRLQALRDIREAAQRAAQVADRCSHSLATSQNMVHSIEQQLATLQDVDGGEISDECVEESPLKARAERVIELGNYWAKVSEKERINRKNQTEQVQALEKAVKQVGGYAALATRIKQKIMHSNK